MRLDIMFLGIIYFVLLGCSSKVIEKTLSQQNEDKIKTTFQSSAEWRPTIDIRADAVMIYGTKGNPSDRERGKSFEDRIQSWRDKGYQTDFMTGIAWGEYKDYFTGKWDGERHLDEGQVTKDGDTIWHGEMVPYIVPSMNYLKYIKEAHVKKVIDAGIGSIFLEEPEFWARAGYSEAFKKEWKDFYGFDWRPQHESPENTYLANKLKYELYNRAIDEVCSFAKSYGVKRGIKVKCYVPTHSLVNYSQWKIVSPEASLASLDGVDGYIAQVWTGTAREPNYFNGKERERTFETAFLEYGSMESMTSPTGRKIFFLTDPIEDNANKDWEDYKKNYQATFTAQLLYPNVSNYEVMPWPERIYEGLYRISGRSDKKERIPQDYSSQLQIMVNSLNDMPETENKLSGSKGISVMMSNSLMFQRYPTHFGYDDPQLSNFYGLALPLLKRGVPVNTVHMENLKYKKNLEETKVLLMTYSNMKPMKSDYHKYLANWVKKGGVIFYVGTDDDPFQSVREWWNTEGFDYDRPSDHLFELMGISNAREGRYKYGKGLVYVLRQDPKSFVVHENNDEEYVNKVKALYDDYSDKGKLEFKNNFHLTRGPYEIIAVMDESVSDSSFTIKGKLIDLYNYKLPVYSSREIFPGEQGLLLNIDKISKRKKPQILAAASRSYKEKSTPYSFSYISKGPKNTINRSRVLLPKRPNKALINGESKLEIDNWDAETNTYFLEFENSPEGVPVEFEW